MKILSLKFSKIGFDFEQLQRAGRLAVYRKSKPHQNASFEAIRIGSHEDYMLAGNLIAASETYPSSETWGTNGFTFNDENAAMVKFNRLVRAAK